MKLDDFMFDLPEELIAQVPIDNRSDSRLMHINKQAQTIDDKSFTDIVDFLNPHDLLIFNDTKVIPARTYAKRPTGGIVEVMVERFISDRRVSAYLKASNTPRPGLEMTLIGGAKIVIVERQRNFFILDLVDVNLNWIDVLEDEGKIPLPPYITRDVTEEDLTRYQTVYAKNKGAVAAPTAGLHFDDDIFKRLKEKNIDHGFVTLHVGAGTFEPVRIQDFKNHQMHSEQINVTQELADKVNATKKNGGRIIAVGTTCVRTLESAWGDDMLKPCHKETEIFIYPGYDFKCVNAMITNFHLPGSTLILLVSAFVGSDLIKQSYQHAIDKKYRFFSYGDAMLLER